MTDYLHHLVERSLTPTSVLRPRLSLFESPPLTGDVSFRADEGLSAAATAPPVEQLDERIRPIKSRSAASMSLAEFADARSEPRLHDQPQAIHLETEQDTTPTPTRESRTPVSNRPAPPPPPPEPLDKRNDSQREIARKVEGHKITAAETETPLFQRPRSISFPGKAAAADSIEQRPRDDVARKIVETISASPRVPERAPPPGRAFRPESPRMPSLRPLFPAEQSKAWAEPPSINVTIGRVEVRATLPPAVARTPRRSAPIESLDEYLRRRSGGDRR